MAAYVRCLTENQICMRLCDYDCYSFIILWMNIISMRTTLDENADDLLTCLEYFVEYEEILEQSGKGGGGSRAQPICFLIVCEILLNWLLY